MSLFEDLDRALNSLVKLSVAPLILLVICGSVITLINQMPPMALLALLFLFVCASPIAYVIRARTGHGERQPARRGAAERTPLFPVNGQGQE